MDQSIRQFLTAVKGFFRLQSMDYSHNPIHLAVARQGYRIQSQKLHIPDRFGLFSPGPAFLQEHQGATLAKMIVVLGFVTLLDMFFFF
jgi:hypothetical protein